MMTSPPLQASSFTPRIAYKPMPAVRKAPGRELGLMICGALLLFSSVLFGIAFAVQIHAYATAAAHFAANESLTAEARELGVAGVRSAALVRAGVFGPGGLALGIAGLVALFVTPRRKR